MSELYWETRDDVIQFYLGKGYDEAAASERADEWERLRASHETKEES